MISEETQNAVIFPKPKTSLRSPVSKLDPSSIGVKVLCHRLPINPALPSGLLTVLAVSSLEEMHADVIHVLLQSRTTLFKIYLDPFCANVCRMKLYRIPVINRWEYRGNPGHTKSIPVFMKRRISRSTRKNASFAAGIPT